MTAATTIRADDLRTLLAAVKLRKYSHGRTPLLAAMSPAPLLECDCHTGRTPAPSWRLQAQTMGASPARVTPISRGFITMLYERVAREQGRQGVVKTWRTGIRALRAEPRYALFGGQA